jgi:prepilin-type N-terminal cleavage/methylation domain-containing protein
VKSGQRREVLGDLPAALSSNFLKRHFTAAAAEDASRERVPMQAESLVQVIIERPIHFETLIVRSRRVISTPEKHTRSSRPLHGFTLVELLVVITIIGILASLITVAAVGALRKAHETRIKVEVDQIDSAIEEYKNKTTAYPPNCRLTAYLNQPGRLTKVRCSMISSGT